MIAMAVLPESIKKLIGNEGYSIDKVGMSTSTVILFKDKILKIQESHEEWDNEYNMMKWLQGKLPVPKVLGFERENGKDFLLMTKIPGEMSCDHQYMKDPVLLTTILAEALQMLWKVDISNCPYSCNVEKKLHRAKYAIEHNLVDMDDVEADTFGEKGFKNPNDLLEWLIANKPEEELALSHGDFCLPNIFLLNKKVSGFIDLGNAGIADKWQDIALCYRSLLHNFHGKYTEKTYDGFKKDLLFEKLGIEPDWNKIRYYILLDELF